jgi:hypothetical protein
MRAIALPRTAELYITEVCQAALTKLSETFLAIQRCPGWDSNPHCTVFEAADSAVGLPGLEWREVGGARSMYLITVLS